jgi:hypothetical protein
MTKIQITLLHGNKKWVTAKIGIKFIPTLFIIYLFQVYPNLAPLLLLYNSQYKAQYLPWNWYPVPSQNHLGADRYQTSSLDHDSPQLR